MLHLLPLPESPGYQGQLAQVKKAALLDAENLANAGMDGLLLENFGDVPFHPASVPASVVGNMAVIAAEIRQRFQLPLGINVLRNDGCAGLAVAHASGADFIRVNVLVGARLTDQGLVSGIAHELLRLRNTLSAHHISIFADVNVKHSAPLADYPLADEVRDTVCRGLADALIVSGGRTGVPTSSSELLEVKASANSVPVWVGSGVDEHAVAKDLANADGYIVGTATKANGNVHEPVDFERAKAIIDARG